MSQIKILQPSVVWCYQVGTITADLCVYWKGNEHNTHFIFRASPPCFLHLLASCVFITRETGLGPENRLHINPSRGQLIPRFMANTPGGSRQCCLLQNRTFLNLLWHAYPLCAGLYTQPDIGFSSEKCYLPAWYLWYQSANLPIFTPLLISFEEIANF